MANRITTNYKELIVWQKSMDLAVAIFEITKRFPKEELYGIVSQIRRAAFSIPSNIAEGYCRGRRAGYRQFLQIAYGSAAEVEAQLIIAHRTKMLSPDDFESLNNLLQEILKMLNKMILSLKL